MVCLHQPREKVPYLFDMMFGLRFRICGYDLITFDRGTGLRALVDLQGFRIFPSLTTRQLSVFHAKHTKCDHPFWNTVIVQDVSMRKATTPDLSITHPHVEIDQYLTAQSYSDL